VLERALVTNGPVVVEAVVDPYEPPMPPKVTLEQTYKLAKSLVRGTARAGPNYRHDCQGQGEGDDLKATSESRDRAHAAVGLTLT